MRLNTISYYADFFISLALVLVFAGTAAMRNNWMLGGEWWLFVCLGGASWTLIEYVVHRWLYHNIPCFRQVHDAHHAEPNAYIGAPPILGIILIVGACFTPFLGISFNIASGATTGMLIGYMAYMLVHHAAHYWNLPPASWLYRARRHHALHHHHSEDCNFGITTSFWDHAFGTAYCSRRGRLQSRPIDH